jgi:hypothetical protein
VPRRQGLKSIATRTSVIAAHYGGCGGHTSDKERQVWANRKCRPLSLLYVPIFKGGESRPLVGPDKSGFRKLAYRPARICKNRYVTRVSRQNVVRLQNECLGPKLDSDFAIRFSP